MKHLLPGAIVIKDLEGRTVFSSGDSARLTLLAAESLASIDPPLAAARNQQRLSVMEDGSAATASLGLAPLRDDNGLIIGTLAVAQDVAAPQTARHDPDGNHRLLRTLMDALPDVVYSKDIEGRFVVCNRAALTLHGFDHEYELAGKTILDVLPAEMAERVQADDLRVLRGYSVVDREDRSTHLSGMAQWHRTIKVPLRDAGGRIVGLIGISRDITERRLAQQDSRELVERLGNTLESLSDGFCNIDRDWRFTYVNRQAQHMLRRRRADLLGGVLWQRLPALEGTPFATALKRAMADNEIVQIVERFGRLSRWYEVRIHPTRRGLAVYMRDVSRQRQLADQLEVERLRLLALQAVVMIGSWSIELPECSIEWSEETCRIFGADPLQFRPTYPLWLERVHADDRAAMDDMLRQSFAQVGTYLIEHRLPPQGDSSRFVEERWQVYPGEDGRPRQALGTTHDITERSLSARALQQSQALLDIASRLGRIGAWSLDLVGDTLLWSDEVRAIHEIEPGTLLGLEQALGCYAPASAATMRQACEACASEGTPFDFEAQITTAQGRPAWVRVIGEAIRGEGGPARRILGAIQDISERKQAQAQESQLTARLTNTLESIADGFYTVDRDWRFTYVNREAERALKRRREELIGRVLWEEFPLLGAEFERGCRRAVAQNVTVTQEAYFGQWESWYRVNIYPSREGLAIYFRDTTSERASRQQLELLEASVSQLNDIVIITEVEPLEEPGPRILFVNDAFVQCTGHAREDVLGRSPRFLQGPLTDRTVLARIRTALADFEPVHAELVNYRRNGEAYWIELDIVPVGVRGSGYSHFVAVQRDITERKRDQDALRELNAQLEARVLDRTAELNLARIDAEKASRAKSTFLATMSHEIRTPMNGVIGMIEVLHQTSLKGYQVEMVDLIRDSAFSLLEIIDDILDFSKIEAGRLEIENAVLPLSEAIEKVCAMLDQMAVKRDVRLMLFIDPAIPRSVSGDGGRVRQVLINLISNAVKFSGAREQFGQVYVRAQRIADPGPEVLVEISVTDNGIGMDQATIDRLFTAFSQADVSTTRRFGGTGLGLAISSTLVKLMGGHISVKSAPGQGSTFIVQLRFGKLDDPAIDEPAHEHESVAGLHCCIVGSELPLGDDIGAYLAHAQLRVTRAPDLATAPSAVAANGGSRDPIVWIILPDQHAPAIVELRAMASHLPQATHGFVVFGHGKRRRLRSDVADLVVVDAEMLYSRTLFKAMAIASGRLPEKVATGKGVETQQIASAGSRSPPSHDQARLQGRLVLVAEDNETNRAVILRQLALIGLAAEVVVNGREALKSWRSGDFGLLLTDLHMPEMDGYELAAAIRSEESAARRTPIIALTANALPDEELRCRTAGMDAYLTKPIRLKALTEAIDAWLPQATGVPALPAPRYLPPATPPPVDLRVLVDLVGSDLAMIEDVLRSFRRTGEQASHDLRRAMLAGSAKAVGAAMHRFNSGARAIGAARLSGVCSDIESMSEAQGTPALESLISRFEVELEAVSRFLDARSAIPVP